MAELESEIQLFAGDLLEPTIRMQPRAVALEGQGIPCILKTPRQ